MALIPRKYEDLDAHEFVMLVEQKINRKIMAQASFSAYMLTKELRDENPDVNIIHNTVRHIVHNKMAGGAYGGHPSPHSVDYRAERRNAPDGRPHIMYIFDPGWETRDQEYSEEANRVALALIMEESPFSLGDAFSMAQQKYANIDEALFAQFFVERAAQYGWRQNEQGLFEKAPDIPQEDEEFDDDAYIEFDEEDEDDEDVDDEPVSRTISGETPISELHCLAALGFTITFNGDGTYTLVRERN